MAKKILILGSGIVGLCSAHFAALDGHEVVVVDRSSPEPQSGSPGAAGCSYGNAGMIVPSHFVPLASPGMVALGLKWMWNPESPFYIQPRLDWNLFSWGWKFWRAANRRHVERSAPLLRDLHLASRAAFEEFAARPGFDFGLEQRGLLMLCKTAHALAEEARAAEKARQLGIPAEVLNPAQTAVLDPGARLDIEGAVHYPRDCHLSPHRFMAGLRADLEKRGVQFAWNTEAAGWRVRGGKIEALRAAARDFEVDEFVLAAGSWSPALTRDLGLKLPMQAGKGYSVTLANPPQLPQICSILTEARVAVTPMGGTLRVGGTMEIGGLNDRINPARVRGIIQSLPKYYPEFSPEHFAGIQPWFGLRPCSPDGLPYLGRLPNLQNLVIATGHAMMGLSLGPVTGKLVADLLSSRKPQIEIGLLRPDRMG